MRVIFFGTARFAVPGLERLVEAGHAISVCVTRPDRPRGRGLIAEPSPVKQAALRLGVPLSQPDRQEAGAVRALNPDVGVVAAYGQLLSRELLELPKHGMLGIHPSLLPKYRGAAPVAWALLNGESATGVTIFRLNERLDAGEIIRQHRVAIEEGEDAEALTARLALLGARELVEALDALSTGRARFSPQDEAGATVAPKLTKEQGTIDWRRPAAVIDRVIRGTIPWPGATTAWSGGSLKVWKASLVEGPLAATDAVPGTVVEVSGEAITVSTGAGWLALLDVQPAGRRRMTVREFLAGHHISVGDRLGAPSVKSGQ